MAGKIFINYRRGDAPDSTGRLYDRLEQEFGADNLFMDVEGHIKPGDDFVHVLDSQVAASDIILAVIGPRWTEIMRARDAAADDFVAIEIKSALERQKRVIPVLVGGAAMPRADDLPEEIRSISRRNALGLRSERFKADVQGLVTALKEQLAAVEAERSARSAAEREAAEAARRKADEDAAVRASEAEKRRMVQLQAGLTAEQIEKAEELARWDFIKDSTEAQDFRDHLARFPKGVVAPNARAKLEAALWNGIANAPEGTEKSARLSSFLEEFPDGKFAGDARVLQENAANKVKEENAKLERKSAERDAWAEASRINTAAAFREFLARWPDGEHAAAAKSRVKELKSGTRNRFAIGTLSAIFASVVAYSLIIPAKKAPVAQPQAQRAPPRIYTLADADARFSVVNNAIKAKKSDLNTVKVVGIDEVDADGKSHNSLDAACLNDQRGMAALRGMGIAFALYGMASNGLVETSTEVPSIGYPDEALSKLTLKDKDASLKAIMSMKTRLPAWVFNSGDLKAFAKELLAYKSKFEAKAKSIEDAKSSPGYENIADLLGDPKSDKPCYNETKYLNVGPKTEDEYWYIYGVINPHGYFYSFWYRRKLEGSTDFAEKLLRLYVGS